MRQCGFPQSRILIGHKSSPVDSHRLIATSSSKDFDIAFVKVRFAVIGSQPTIDPASYARPLYGITVPRDHSTTSNNPKSLRPVPSTRPSLQRKQRPEVIRHGHLLVASRKRARSVIDQDEVMGRHPADLAIDWRLLGLTLVSRARGAGLPEGRIRAAALRRTI